MKKIIISSSVFSLVILFSGCDNTRTDNNYAQKEIMVDINQAEAISFIDNAHSNGDTVNCKIPVATYDDNFYDSYSFDESDIGNVVEFDTNLRWVDISTYSVFQIMENRIDDAYYMNCDNVSFENIDIWSSDNGFNIDENIAYQYYTDLTEIAHNFGMDVGSFEIDYIDEFGSEADIYDLFDFILD